MSILEQIVSDTREVLAKSKRNVTLRELESQEGFEREPLSLAQACRADGLSVIAEVKKASPSAGVLREDFDPLRIATAYAEAGAAAVSILTEPLHFQGSPDFIRQARPYLEIPILRKDFIIDPYQIAEARAMGADAVLLIATILDGSHLSELLDACVTFGVTPLVELYDIREVDRVDLDRVDVVGVNSRDLNTFEVDLERAIEALQSLPTSIVRVAESGIRNARDGVRLAEAGIDAALIGETFMRQDQPGSALARFLDEVRSAQ